MRKAANDVVSVIPIVEFFVEIRASKPSTSDVTGKIETTQWPRARS